MAKDKKHIDQIVFQSFSNNNEEKFDMPSWSKIAKKLNKKNALDKAILAAFKSEPQELPDYLWEDINDALDIETVWKRLEKRTKRKPVVFWWKIAAILLLVSLLTEQLINYTKLPNNTDSSIKKNTYNKNIKKETFLFKGKQQAENTLNNKSNYHNYQTIVANSKNGVPQNNIYNNITQQPNLKTVKNSTITKNKVDSHTINKINPKIKLIPVKPNIEKQFLTNNFFDTLCPLPTKKLSIGVVGVADNTWILDVVTKLGFSENSLVYNDFEITPSVGVFVNYNLKQNYSIHSEVFFNATQKTKNNLFIEGNLAKKETKIEYFKCNLSIAKNIYFGKKPLVNSIQFSGGVYGAYLLKSSIRYTGIKQTKSETPAYKKFDYGTVFGISHQINLKNFIINYGIHSNYGLNNIYKGNNTLPTLFNKTHNFAYGIHIKLAYKM